MDFPEISGALRLFFLGFCGAKPICFLGGNELQGAATAALLFLTAIGGFYLVQWKCVQLKSDKSFLMAVPDD